MHTLLLLFCRSGSFKILFLFYLKINISNLFQKIKISCFWKIIKERFYLCKIDLALMISNLLIRVSPQISKAFHIRRNCFSTLVIAEHNNGKMNPVTSKILTAASNFQQEVWNFLKFLKLCFYLQTHLLITGNNLESVLKAYQTNFCEKCFQKIFVAEHAALEHKY